MNCTSGDGAPATISTRIRCLTTRIVLTAALSASVSSGPALTTLPRNSNGPTISGVHENGTRWILPSSPSGSSVCPISAHSSPLWRRSSLTRAERPCIPCDSSNTLICNGSRTNTTGLTSMSVSRTLLGPRSDPTTSALIANPSRPACSPILRGSSPPFNWPSETTSTPARGWPRCGGKGLIQCVADGRRGSTGAESCERLGFFRPRGLAVETVDGEFAPVGEFAEDRLKCLTRQIQPRRFADGRKISIAHLSRSAEAGGNMASRGVVIRVRQSHAFRCVDENQEMRTGALATVDDQDDIQQHHDQTRQRQQPHGTQDQPQCRAEVSALPFIEAPDAEYRHQPQGQSDNCRQTLRDRLIFEMPRPFPGFLGKLLRKPISHLRKELFINTVLISIAVGPPTSQSRLPAAIIANSP